MLIVVRNMRGARLGKIATLGIMSIRSRELACGPGWRVHDVACTAGPRDRPFEEQHLGYAIAIVTAGSFGYRSTAGRSLLSPGALLLGGPGQCFECGHEHATGDRCLSFRFDPVLFEGIAATVPGVHRVAINAASLPQLPELQPLLVEAEIAAVEADATALEEIAVRLGGAVLTMLGDSRRASTFPTLRDERRVTKALRRIERDFRDELPLAVLAGEAAMSPYHFLRVFRQVVGLTPHQYALRVRMQRAALQLAESTNPVTRIALDCGFGDVPTFTRRFRRIMGRSPTAFRARHARYGIA